MRVLLATTVLSAALLAACGSSAPPPPPPPAVAPIANAVTGTIALIEPRELSDAAKVDIKVYDVAHPEIVLAQTTIPNAKQLPLSFNLPIDTNKVDPKGIYALDAILTDGDRRFLKKLEYQVLTDKARTAKVDVQLAPEPTPAEKLFEEYKKAAAQTGNLKQISGKYSNDNFGTAWDAFTSNGKVKFVREVTDAYDDSGRTTYKIAYKDDKPWVIVRESSPVGSRSVLATTKVGWATTAASCCMRRLPTARPQTSPTPMRKRCRRMPRRRSTWPKAMRRSRKPVHRPTIRPRRVRRRRRSIDIASSAIRRTRSLRRKKGAVRGAFFVP